MMKRIHRMITAAAVVVCMAAVTACGNSAPKENAPATGGAAAETQAAASSGETAGSGETAKEKIEVKLGFAESENSVHYKGYQYMCDKITEATQGQVTFKLYPSNSLGNERDLYEGCQLGTVDACIITNAVLTNFIPEAAVLDQPFLFDDYNQAWKFIDGPFGDYVEDKAEAGGVKIVGWMDSGFRSLFTKKNVDSVASLKGLKIRTMENEYHMAAYNALGCIATPMASGDVFTALQQGTIDGAENTIPTIVASKFNEVCNYVCNQPVIFAYQLLVFSDDLWAKIPEEYHDAVIAAAAEGCQYQRTLLRDSVADFRTDLESQGVTFFDLDLDELKSRTQEAMKQFSFDEEALKLMNEELAKLQ